MKLLTKRIVLSLWILIATLALARLWLVRTDLFPAVPESVGIWLVEQYGAKNAEEIRDLEVLLGLSVSFLLVAGSTAIVLFVLRKARRPDAGLG